MTALQALCPGCRQRLLLKKPAGRLRCPKCGAGLDINGATIQMIAAPTGNPVGSPAKSVWLLPIIAICVTSIVVIGGGIWVASALLKKPAEPEAEPLVLNLDNP